MDLIEAAQNGNLQQVQELIKNGADVHAQNDRAFMGACWNGHLPVVEYLLAHEANIHAQNERALIYASENGHLPVVEYLLAHGANINVLSLEKQEMYRIYFPKNFTS